MAPICITKASPGKGTGTFTTVAVEPGTVLLHDTQRLRLKRPSLDTSAAQVETALSLLPASQRKTFFSLHENNLPYTSRALRIYKSNCFGDEQHTWMYFSFARVNHACAPNAELADVDDVDDTKLVALRRIAAGEEVLITYLGPFDDGPRGHRAPLLKETYGFECRCEVCGLTGERARVSDMRRGLIKVLSHWQVGLEVAECRPVKVMNDLVEGEDEGRKKEKMLVRGSLRKMKTELTPVQRVQYNFLLAKLFEAEGQIGYRLAEAYTNAGGAVMRQLIDSLPFVVLPTAKLVLEWFAEGLRVMRSIRAKDSRDVRELERVCGEGLNGVFWSSAKEIMAETMSDGTAVFATVIRGPRHLTQEECIAERRTWLLAQSGAPAQPYEDGLPIR